MNYYIIGLIVLCVMGFLFVGLILFGIFYYLNTNDTQAAASAATTQSTILKNKNKINNNNSVLKKLMNFVKKQECYKADGNMTSCFEVTRNEGKNLVDTKYIEIIVEPKHKEIYTASEQYTVVYDCKFYPYELEENQIVLFDDGALTPEIMTINREKGTMKLTFKTSLNSVTFHVYPFIPSLSIMKITVNDNENVEEEMTIE